MQRAIGMLSLCLGMMIVLTGCQGYRNTVLSTSLDNLSLLSDAQTRSISPESFTGEKGKGGMATEGTGKNAARELGQKWKVSPSIVIKAGTIFDTAARKVERDPDAFVECVFGLTKDTHGPLVYEVGDEQDMRDPKHRRAIRRWFEDVG